MQGNNSSARIEQRMAHLYGLILRFDELFRRCRVLSGVWAAEPDENRRSMSINMHVALAGVIESYQEIASAGASSE